MEYNANIIPIKARLRIETLDQKNYNKINLCKYQHLIDKLI